MSSFFHCFQSSLSDGSPPQTTKVSAKSIVPPSTPVAAPTIQPLTSAIWQDTHHVTNMAKHIENYWRDGVYTDVIIRVEDESLPVS